MATYAVGDVQGCFDSLQRLLDKIEFSPGADQVWFCGDLVNRGIKSLETLRFIKNLGSSAITVLGNHDFHLIAIASGNKKRIKDSNFDMILAADDKAELITWLRQQPLLHYDESLGYVITHAGIYPWWDLATAQRCSLEVQQFLSGPNYLTLVDGLYGNLPDHWEESHEGLDRLRFSINAFTRMRYCYDHERLNLDYKGAIDARPAGTTPWFHVADRVPIPANILFGHWASLECKVDVPQIFGLDSGCVWGNALTAMRLEDQQRFSVSC